MKHIFLTLIAWLVVMGIEAAHPIEFNIVFIGNSITQGVQIENPDKQAPPPQATRLLNERGFIVKSVNCGVSGATTYNFLPGQGHLFSPVIQAADHFYATGKPLVFSVMLGTNDSAVAGTTGAPVSPDQYYKNMEVIIDSLLSRYSNSTIIIHRPIWYSPNTHNGSIYLSEGLARLKTYTPKLKALEAAHPGRVFVGDKKAYSYFKKNHLKYLIPENGNSGVFYLHPNAEGAEKLGDFWAKAIAKRMNEELKK
ncbi:GDSL-type esterase/lipase family protein [Coprobacter tertius]|uniref:GDSL-type esterase/lipase family protein n=1 Tax=Coprobacter tertius TaxID=2944915 RepID=A0ABT1MDA4_9BACT|nr:GDSL-type esterase/lipase family protein [Coprobacter tertius]MCP9610618.1 GDSL-type esterase/lipase family protein [Coprobacter tertius]